MNTKTSQKDYFKQVEEELNQFSKLIKDGFFEDIVSAVASEKNITDLSNTVFGDKTSRDEEVLSYQKLIRSHIKDGVPYQYLLEIEDDEMEVFYFLAHTRFNEGSYAQSFHLFRMLVNLNPLIEKYHYGMACSLHKQKEYKRAITSYAMAAVFSTETYNPLPHYHSADCYIKLKTYPEAAVMLNVAEQSCNPNNPEHNILKERCKIIQNVLIQQHQERKAEEQLRKQQRNAKNK
ncbi:SycD/LcrH family type III secretion system chaperone [Chlamydiia bacterium]|jgi:type III secretion system low calcium response chaperone LcrH/SycD|nr:SycD/LcrH family type III secretion system chaperone [Chlamydiia bacterium]